MSLSPELHIALQRITACNNSERLLMVVREDLAPSHKGRLGDSPPFEVISGG